MYHNIILIYELLRLKEEVTKESATSLDCLENAFIELQLIINEDYDLKEKRNFAEALEEVIDIYGFLFDIEEDMIAFNDEYQYEQIEDAILEILDNKVTYIDDSIADLKHNIMIYQALELDIPVEEMNPIFKLNKNIVIYYGILALSEIKNYPIDSIINKIVALEEVLDKFIKKAPEETITKIKLCIANLNNIYLIDNHNPLNNIPWYIILLNSKENLLKTLQYERINELLIRRDYIRYNDDNINTENSDLIDFLKYYLILLNKSIEIESNEQIKNDLIYKKYLLLMISPLEDFKNEFLEEKTLSHAEFLKNQKDFLETDFIFIPVIFKEIMQNICKKDKDINESELIINLLLLKTYLDLSINEQIKQQIKNNLTNNKYYKNTEYKTFTNYVDEIIFKEREITRN